MKKMVLKIVKNNKFLGNMIRNIYIFINKIIYKGSTLFTKTDAKTILFGSFNGRSYCDSPKAIYEYMLNNEKYKNYKFIWIFKNINDHTYLLKNKHTKLVKANGIKFYLALKTAKFWFLNYNIEDYIIPTKKQVFIECWHGTPLKRLGCDLIHVNSALNSLHSIRKKYKSQALKFNYFISPSAFASEKFRSIWDMNRVGKENCIIEEGYPRNDALFHYKKEDIQKIKNKLKIDTDKKIILYAPTYRDNQHKEGVGYTYKTEVDFDYLKKNLSNEYIILFRSHWLVANNFDFKKYDKFIYDVSSYDDINDLYIISDILITDYSSVFFDFANLKRPILFYMYDLKKYRDEIRGFYIDLKDLPGPIVQEEKELIKQLKNIEDFYDQKYKKFNKKFNYLDDGNASKRVIEKVLQIEGETNE